ncbi:5'-nucleotidase C-terminal domain-containing protein [Clostridium estertheticum]|uniref:5'-nucleotidase C-terminal domain-containing protein n=1 Tax=Clostridium estertheticum TaxID=238834 RepID=UPI001C0AD10A|nr:5'-nucleotidase C-terminal domain-containing protein [Clostridium estertheticum]MBU3197751.1 5'-nucleotidase C-terminal domain-containing protein [Clostridium estertheticum]WAG65553.1 5'-nucleotidase C-terminal domain-containing protein [Clostridium estertheticum]
MQKKDRKKEHQKLLSIIITLTLVLFNFSGLLGAQNVKADPIITSTAESVATTGAKSTVVIATTNKTFDIVDITDFHGQLLDSTNKKPVGAALSKIVKDVKATNPDRTLIIGGGDLYQGTPVSNVLRGLPVQKVFSDMGMEVTALGNHEFDWGLETIDKTMIGASYSIVCANMYKKGTSERPYAPYKIITKDGVKIAVIGAILQDAPNIIMPALVAPYDFKDVATETNKEAKNIRDNNLADIVLLDVHDGGTSLNTTVNKLHGVDAVFGGHTHTIGDVVNKDGDNKDVPTLTASSVGKGYVDLKITVGSDKKIIAFSPKDTNWNPITVTETSKADPTAKKIVDDASATLLPIFNEVIGKDDTALTKEQVDSPYGESQLGNWMADVVKNYSKSKAEVGVVNNGGIRLSPIAKGNVTVGTIFNIMPFDNTICTVTMTGAQLKYIFEQAVKTDGVGIQISGVKFRYDSSKQSYVSAKVALDGTITPEVLGKRVQNITRESDGSIVKDTDIIKVNAPDFVATGGDSFTGFVNPTIKASLVDSHYTVRDALNDDVRANGKITAIMNNRIDNVISKISIIGTSDVHGAIYPLDYNTGLAANVGLAKVSTYVKSVRASNPNTMLIDAGDTIQGTPLSYYYDMIDTASEYPMMKVMGAMGYDTWTLGNHEFNYGLTTLNRIIGDASKEKIAVLSANTYKSDDSNYVKPYIMKSFTVNGKTTKVAVLGLTTKTIASWEDPAHYTDLHFDDLVLEAQKWVPIIKAAGADVVIASIHSGIKGASDTIPENQTDAVAQEVPGIDAILCGHTHTGKTYSYTNPEGKVVPVVEPKNGDGIFSQIDLDIDAKGNYVGVDAYDVTLPATTIADPEILAIAKPYQDATLKYTNTVIGKSTAIYEGEKQLTLPSTIMELVNKVQADAAGTSLSIAAPLSLAAKVPKGDVKRQDIMGVYVFENFLFGLKMTGAQLKDWLEWSVRYYAQVAKSTDPIVKDSVLNIADYNLDQLYGATYDIDLTQPACTVDSKGKVITGNRIKNLKINGVLVNDTEVLKVAVNNYRYNGGGGFMAAAGFTPGSKATIDATFYDSAKVLGDDGQVRNIMFKYVQDKGTITPTLSNNWKISRTKVDQDASTNNIAVPTAIKLVPSKNSISISWDKVTGANGYGVYRATSSAGPYVLISAPKITKYNSTGLTSNKNYYYSIRSYKMVKGVKVNSPYSDLIRVKSLAS